jgi:hypothetical protein
MMILRLTAALLAVTAPLAEARPLQFGDSALENASISTVIEGSVAAEAGLTPDHNAELRNPNFVANSPFKDVSFRDLNWSAIENVMAVGAFFEERQ